MTYRYFLNCNNCNFYEIEKRGLNKNNSKNYKQSDTLSDTIKEKPQLKKAREFLQVKGGSQLTSFIKTKNPNN